jgi:hypothetical protein
MRRAKTAIRYGLEGPGIEFRWEARFSAPVQTCPGAHPVSCTMGTGSFPGVKRPGVALTTHPHLAPRLKSRTIPLLPLWAFVTCSRVHFNFTFITRRLQLTMERSKNLRRPYKRQFQLSSVCTGNSTLICISRLSYGSSVHPEHNTCLF